ncbi:MAG: CmcI family methyltransferase [Syntrophales bacterium]|nr:CmcI family methyltransferase [Syntrophales bacterium]MDD5640359.1 CmcI family methyltransferase [Syntrophales bacterium]
MKKLEIDFLTSQVTVFGEESSSSFSIGTQEAFSAISNAWLRSGWDTKYVYTFTWMGRPIIQLPEDMFRVQEVIYRVKPDVIIETGIAHGGSLIFYAGLCKMMGRGRIIGIDIEIRPHNRKAIEEHELFEYITLIEGSSIDEKVVSKVKSLVKPQEKVFVMLDSNHSKQHVLAELTAYADLVSIGSYIVASDGIMANLVGAPRSSPDWSSNNPQAAALEFIRQRREFEMEQPPWLFNESHLTENVTYWPDAWLRRTR